MLVNILVSKKFSIQKFWICYIHLLYYHDSNLVFCSELGMILQSHDDLSTKYSD